MKHYNHTSKSLAWFFLCVFSFSIFYPNYSFAGGPKQPEVQGFTPASVSDMVDPFTGDFTYNIPLIEIEGYPINLAYNSGVTMDQEASWVGLGWTLHSGAISRGLRGLPDDFDGDIVEKAMSTKPNTNIGLDVGAGAEFFGFANVNAGVGINYNNYNGFGVNLSISPSFSFAVAGGMGLTAGLSLSGSSENGASFSPSLTISSKMKGADKSQTKLGLTVGSSMNSRAGLQAISYGTSISKIEQGTAAKKKKEKPKIGKNGISGSVGNGSFDLGLANYSPSAGPSMTGISLMGSVAVTGTAWGVDAQANLGINFSSNWIPEEKKIISSKAYGYMNSGNGVQNGLALLDFNRDNDASFSKYTKDLPSAFQTYDIFSIQAQGVGGSFRAFRNEVGFVYDPLSVNESYSGSFGLELGVGGLADIGGDINVGYTESRTGKWKQNNDADDYLQRITNNPGQIVPEFNMLEANEKSVDYDLMVDNSFSGSDPVQFRMSPTNPQYSNLTNALQFSESSTVTSTATNNKRGHRVITNNQLYFLSNQEVIDGYGVDNFKLTGTDYKPHHIGEITQLGQDGRRYVFGLPVYNHFQNDITFAVGETIFGTQSYVPSNYFSGLVSLGNDFADVAGFQNKQGIDNFYSNNRTPAYAHSFMLTSILSDDYVDADPVQGPSEGDLGSYVKFEYEKVADHQWRTPVGENTAFYNEGMKSDPKDDKASFVSGEKDLYYVVKIESKNQVLVFQLNDPNSSPRLDGASAVAYEGGLSVANAKKQRYLEKISLYNLNDFDQNGGVTGATPIQEVHFEYDYSQCVGFPNNSQGGGKLTLKEIYFTYQGSNKMSQRRYKFEYNSLNPNYDMKAVDRWGSYKPNTGTVDNSLTPTMTNADFPYTTQNKALADDYASAWHMTDIELPSGGKIHVDYEADDYGYVQHKPAQRMFEVVGTSNQNEYLPTLHTSPSVLPVTETTPFENHANKAIYFKLDNPTDELSEYIVQGQQLYFRCLTDFSGLNTPLIGPNSKTCEYVSGYADVKSVSTITNGGEKYGRILLEPITLQDSGPEVYSPIAKAAILFGRIHLARTINEVISYPNQDPGEAEQALKDFANAAVGAISSFQELVDGPNIPILENHKGTRIISNKSFIRLREPNGTKIGGGSRVAKITMSDKWNSMTDGTAQTSQYGQEYEYKLENGKSSGVASYEPQIGGDENPWHSAYPEEKIVRFAPDDNLFIEDPLMESQFPSPGVGYSRVTISSLKYSNVKRTATGRVVKEFFTAKDFPTVVKRSNVQVQSKTSKLPFIDKYQLLNASQGFVIELNDMHGKPKTEKVYGEDQTAPLSSVEYRYQMETLGLDGAQNYKLNNKVQTINRAGNVDYPEIGVRYDVVADFRESETKSSVMKLPLNVNVVLIVIPIPIPTVWPKIDNTQNRFRSSTLNKTINRFGILKETIATQDGSVVSTQNLAYDAETGEVLVTKTKTNFNDDIYSMNYPAYWNYKTMGRASNNVLYSYKVSQISSNGFASVPYSLNNFVEGDEVICSGGGTDVKGWIAQVNQNGIVIINKAGLPIAGSNVTVKVIRSGYKNKQSTSMAQMTSYKNPISSFKSNAFSQVLNATAVEFSQEWKTYCGCFEGDNATSNPYVKGIKGNWRPWRSYTYLTERTQSNYNGNTNIRKDGVYTGYNPFYKINGNHWIKDGENWTYVSEVTEFSPNGMTIETKDALGRFSTNAYGFNNTLTTATAVNTKSTQLAVASFEDAGMPSCTALGFFNEPFSPDTMDIAEEGHTGKKSIRVAANNSVVFKMDAISCNEAEICKFSANFSDTNNINVVSMINGNVPYEMTFNASQGAYAYVVSPTQFQYYFPPNSDPSLTISIKVKDAAGCEKLYILHPYSAAQQGIPISSGTQHGVIVASGSTTSDFEIIEIQN